MKKFLTMIAAMLVSVAMSAQFAQFKQMSLVTPHYYPGEVYFVDGTHESYYEVELPKNNEKKISVKANKEDKKRTTLDAANIIAVKFWHPKFPDKVNILHYLRVPKKSILKDSYWGNPVYVNRWGVLYKCDSFYEVNKKTGELEVVKFVDEYGAETETMCLLKRPGKEEADVLFAVNRFGKQWFMGNKKVAEVFAENEEIYEGIKKGKLQPDDIVYIMETMSGGETGETPTEAVEEKQAESVIETEDSTNGEVGDDE